MRSKKRGSLNFAYVFLFVDAVCFDCLLIICCFFCGFNRKMVAEQLQPIQPPRVDELKASPSEGNVSPTSQGLPGSASSDKSERERQRLREQERRRREAVSLVLV